MTNLMTIDYVAKLHDELEAAEQVARDARARRDEAVLLAVESGASAVQVAARLSVTPGRVSQILARARALREGGAVARAKDAAGVTA